MPVLGWFLAGFVLAVIGFRMRRRRGPLPDDLGPISQQWIADHTLRSRDPKS